MIIPESSSNQGEIMKYLISLIILSVFFLGGCSDSDNKGPADTTAIMDPMAQDDDDQILNADELLVTGSNAARYPTIAGHGILWKPVADSGGKLAVLLNRSYGKPQVSVFNSRGQLVEHLRFYYFSNPNRATYRGSRKGSGYGSPCYIRIAGKYVYKVPNSSRRYE